MSTSAALRALERPTVTRVWRIRNSVWSSLTNRASAVPFVMAPAEDRRADCEWLTDFTTYISGESLRVEFMINRQGELLTFADKTDCFCCCYCRNVNNENGGQPACLTLHDHVLTEILARYHTVKLGRSSASCIRSSHSQPAWGCVTLSVVDSSSVCLSAVSVCTECIVAETVRPRANANSVPD